MANRTDKFAKSIHGTNPQVRRGALACQWRECERSGAPTPRLTPLPHHPQTPPLTPPTQQPPHQNLVEKITRNKIQASIYWKEKCFGLSAETMIDRAVGLRSVGGMYGEPNKPTEFICLILKMLQIQPDFDIVVELIRNEDYKYVRLLGEWRRVLVGGVWLAVTCALC